MDDLAPMRRRLLDERAALSEESEGQADSARPVTLDQSRMGRLSRMDAIQMQEMAAASERHRRGRMQRIDAALARIDAGEFGHCHSCEEPIAPKRLESDLTATLCIACAAAGE